MVRVATQAVPTLVVYLFLSANVSVNHGIGDAVHPYVLSFYEHPSVPAASPVPAGCPLPLPAGGTKIGVGDGLNFTQQTDYKICFLFTGQQKF